MVSFYFRWPPHEPHCGHGPVDGEPLESRYQARSMLVTLPLAYDSPSNVYIIELKSACNLFCIF